MFTALWKHRNFIYNNAINDLRQRYAGSMFGMLWNVFNPLAQILVYTFVFSQVMAARLPELNSNYAFAIYLCAGLLPWISFSETILRGSSSLLENSTYLKKLPIPEQIFVAQTTVSSTLSLGISMVLLFIINFLIGGQFGYGWLSLPLVLLLFQGLAFGIALTMSCLIVFFRDIGQLLGIIMQIWMWMTPIVYVKEILPTSFQKLMVFNPIYPYIEALHDVIVFGKLPEAEIWLYMVMITFVFLIIGTLTINKLRKEIRDVL